MTYYILMVEIPSLLHIHNVCAGAIPTGKAPGVAGINALWRWVQVSLVCAPRVIACVDCRWRAGIKRMGRLHLGKLMKLMDEVDNVLWQR